ncbi:ribonuclease Y [Candidatus Nomurabacteria bacterium]|nr:ribonuclease Y [Candidatus Nomurabacteria bacterium]MCB9820414.1 ribonuclease Y [Candidatus Nomurabacteria bacterium]
MKQIIYMALALFVGAGVGYYIRMAIVMGRKQNIEVEVKGMLVKAKEDAQKIVDEAKQKAEEKLEEAKKLEKEKEVEHKKTEERLIKKEELLDKRQIDLDKDEERIRVNKEALDTREEELSKIEETKQKELEKVSGLSVEEAKNELEKSVERRYEEDLAIKMQKMEMDGKTKLDERAKEILATSIQRLAASVSPDIMTTFVSIPSDEIKGKVIGKEGRNIKAFERAAGVELIVDDTPGAIVISAYDPVRRQIARVALENLIMDGRIQPSKIEEVVEKAKNEINTIIKEKGEQACYECGIFNFDPRLIAILGRLYFRTSYGQNVLQHSVEMAHIAGMIAEEIGADVYVAKAGALVHDIGKALDHEVQGTHVNIGMRILEKFGADPRIITAMRSHHDEYPYESIEAHIVQTADAISGGRPGARRDTVENYLKRLSDIENIANGFDGVEKSYALAAGREVRTFVYPDKINDVEAKELAYNIAKKIEADLKYPGEIKVIVIRENRVVEYAR